MEKLLIVNEVLQWVAMLVIVLWLIFSAAVYRRVFDLQDAETRKLEDRLAARAAARITLQMKTMRQEITADVVAQVANPMRNSNRGV